MRALAAPGMHISKFGEQGKPERAEIFISLLPIGIGGQGDVAFVVELGESHAEIDLRRAAKQSKAHVLANLKIKYEMTFTGLHLRAGKLAGEGAFVTKGIHDA